MFWIVPILLVSSIALLMEASLSLYLLIRSNLPYKRISFSKCPTSYLPAQLSFSVLLPARFEETVIYNTLKIISQANYPPDLVEIIIICHIDDVATITEAQRAIRDIALDNIRIETFFLPPINKAHALNIGFERAAGQIVTIIDAEDTIDPGIFNIINTIMLEEKVNMVQAGVQLMNLNDHWFGIHNCLEYFLWFKFGLHFCSKFGIVPLAGNTAFVDRNLLLRVGGWDEQCLTEDADISLRLNHLGEPIRIVYNAHHVTHEETPDSTISFIKQRTRWYQGFLQVLLKGTWLTFPRPEQKLLVFFIFSYPFHQTIALLLFPVGIFEHFWLKENAIIALISLLPLCAFLLKFLTSILGIRTFVKEYDFRFPLLSYAIMAITFLPFQYLLAISNIRGIYRQLLGINDWEKIKHIGAHRQDQSVSSIKPEKISSSN